MAGISLLRASYTNIPVLFTVLGKPRYNLIVNIFGAIALPLLVVAFGFPYGLYGVMAAWYVFHPLSFCLSLYLIKIVVRIRPLEFFWALVPAAVATAVMVACVGAVDYLFLGELSDMFAFGIKAGVGAVTYGVWLRLVHGSKVFALITSLGTSTD
jgi:O-antigen/teichoic acid export membrane protein